jgi:hypothetical protein
MTGIVRVGRLRNRGSILGMVKTSSSQSVLRRFKGIRDQFPGDPWIHFCNGCFEVYLFFV